MFCTLTSGLGKTPGLLADRTDMKGLSQVIRAGRSFWVEQDGPTVTEYSVLLALIVLGVFSILILIGEFLKGTYTTVSDGLPDGSE